ncbi:hypothetical protein GGR88_001108 [Sphingomonas jejuensis]|uniref:Uncharacterized protein n=1 Tax=Sphingomonas jejuensis TaxID=904715 RepID=A0ABX0XK86_9SPHN|nr:hypothetical protein [Sphingomonas jejuensis]NJC33634.1 hypothetical protein [Sphingomonas jejuensis]
MSQAAPAPAAPVLQRMLDCRRLQDGAARLACFDREAATVDAAQQSREIVVLDRDTAERGARAVETERRRFEPFEGVIAGARQQPNGRWVLRLEDGTQWVQADSETVRREPRAGQTVAVRPAAMGSYFANIDGQRAIRVRPLN